MSSAGWPGQVLAHYICPHRVSTHWKGYTPEDEEDSAVVTASAVWVYQALAHYVTP